MPDDFAGNTLGTARALDITPTIQTFTDYVSPLDTRDFYSFTTSASSSFALTIDGMSANANVRLYDSSKQLVQSSTNSGITAEAINTDLDAGTYYIVVYRGNTQASTYYDLSVSANSAPLELLFSTNKSTYNIGETISITDTWVYDPNSYTDLSSVDFWLSKDGDWVDIADVSNFTALDSDNNGASFDYQLSSSDLASYFSTPSGDYVLWGVAYDQSGAASNEFQTSFTVNPEGNEIILYDGALGGTPNPQGWLTFGTIPAFLGTPATQTASGGVTNVVSSEASPGGYSNHRKLTPELVNSSFPTLDSSTGYTISFDVEINSETHFGDDNGDGLDDRAGFSIIAMSSDLQGIELGFWNNEIWAQETGTAIPSAGGTLFTHDDIERAFVDTTVMTSYDLTILGDSYQLYANDSLILTGTLRSYSAFNHADANLPYDPYETPNFLFLGDNTSSASVDFDLAFVSVTS